MFLDMMQALLSLLLATSTGASRQSSGLPKVSLQTQHPELSPAETLRQLAQDCEQLGLTTWDVYGDFDQANGDAGKSDTTSWLRTFERELAIEFEKDDAVFMPSGVMAQSIALLIHQQSCKEKQQSTLTKSSTKSFACHSSSHLLLHEQDGYKELLNMDAVVIQSDICGAFIQPMSYAQVEATLDKLQQQHDVSMLILELPHRELGGKCTTWHDICRMGEFCQARNIAFHADGARIFEAQAFYNDLTLAQLTEPFDSVYISFYKGLGGMSGAMLLGSHEFCRQARVWLRRFGGNLYTLMPYAASGWAGYRRNWLLQKRLGYDKDIKLLSFVDKRNKLAAIVAELQADAAINCIVTFDPPSPETNMIHGFLKQSVDTCHHALQRVQEQTGIEVLRRVRPVTQDHPAWRAGFQSYFEWSMGEQNGGIPNEMFIQGWNALAIELQKSDDVFTLKE